MSRSTTGSTMSRIHSASSNTATARMMPISFGASGPDSAKVRKTATMTPAAGDDDSPGGAERFTHGVLRVGGGVVVLSCGGEQEQGVVHRHAIRTG